MAAVSVSVGGLWRTSVDVTADTTWEQLKQLIRLKTAVPESKQRLTPCGADESVACGLGDGDEVMCEWGKLVGGGHPLHSAGEEFCPHQMPNARHCAVAAPEMSNTVLRTHAGGWRRVMWVCGCRP